MQQNQNIEEVENSNREFFDKYLATIYDAYHRNSIESHYSQREFLKILCNIRRCNQKVEKILDIGAGTGSLAKHFLEVFPECDLYANDISKEMLDIFKSRVNNTQKNRLILMCSDAMKIFENDLHFDIIATEECLHHIVNYKQLLIKAIKSINQGGFLIIFNEPNNKKKGQYKIVRSFDNKGTTSILREYETFIEKFVFSPFYILKVWYRYLFPEKYNVFRNKRLGYGLDNKGNRLSAVVETYAEGIDGAFIKQTLEREGFKITKYSTGPDYNFYLSYLLSKILGGSHFQLIAKRVTITKRFWGKSM